MFAYIPARGRSKRIHRKNIKKLGESTLLDLVINNLCKVEGLDGIAVSSEDEEILEIAKQNDKVVTLAPREDSLADDHVGFNELIQKDIPRFIEHFGSEDVLFVLATAVLISPGYFEKGIDIFSNSKDSLVMGVAPYPVSPYLALKGSPESGLVAEYPSAYEKDTKELGHHYYDSGSFYLFNFTKFLKTKRLLDLQPVKGVEIPSDLAIDLDDERDWEQLSRQFKLIRD